MPQSAVQTLILFLLMASGFLAGKLKVLTEPVGKGLSRFLVDYVLPCLIIASMQRPLTPELRAEAFSILGLSFAVYAAAFPLAFLLVRLLGLKGPTAGVHGFAGVFSNVAFMGFPVIEAVFGKESLFAASIYNIPFQLLAFSIGAEMIARGSGVKAKLSLRSFVTPAGLASVLGLGLFLLGFAIPAPLLKAMSLLGDTITPLSMALIGAVLARANLKTAFSDWRLYLTSAYRLLVFPLGLYLALSALGFEGRLIGLPVLIAAMPVAANASILAEAYGGDARTGGSLVFVSTAFSLITIPFLASLLFGR